jgi:RimJ/RimL family protein N-acetyltransferase
VTLRTSGERLGLCGLLKRDTLADVDLGFAFLPEHWGRGYAVEAAAAVLDGDAVRLDLSRVVAITSKDNVASGRVLERLGFRLERLVTLTEDPEELRLFGIDLPRRPVVAPV